MLIPPRMQVLVLEDDETLRFVLATYLGNFSQCRVTTAGSLRELETKFNQISKFLGAAILDINLGPNEPTGVDAYHWLRLQGFHGRVIFLTGHALNHPAVQEVCRIQGVKVFEKPVDMEKIEHEILGEVS